MIPVDTEIRRPSSGAAARPVLTALTSPKLEAVLAGWGEPRFRARQLSRWLFQECIFDFGEMRDLPRALRERLAGETTALPLRQTAETVSDAGQTRKALLECTDGNAVEAVLMCYPATNGQRARQTVCISSQVGCAIGCPFCATGLGGLVRNLTAAEIAAQVLFFAGQIRAAAGSDARITNVVFMGQGEPLANFANVWRAIEILHDPDGFGLGARHVTVSTSGLAPRILELAGKPLQVGLAVSLHAPDDQLRDTLVPVNRRYPIAELMAACRAYVDRTNRRISFEYALMRDVNDSLDQARRLADLLQGTLSHVNLIPLNEVAGSPFRPTPWKQLLAFQRVVRDRGISCTVRSERGDTIDAACGQLRARYKDTLYVSPSVARKRNV